MPEHVLWSIYSQLSMDYTPMPLVTNSHSKALYDAKFRRPRILYMRYSKMLES
jgi:hypothetical protein